MSSFIQRYLEYRRVGHGRLAALHYAWMISGALFRRPAIR
jgi:hypothetical protein